MLSIEDEKKQWVDQQLDVSIIETGDFDAGQLEKLRWGIAKGVDISIYAYKELKEKEMEMIRTLLVSMKEEGLATDQNLLALSRYVCLSVANAKAISTTAIAEFKKGIKSGVDVSIYSDPAYTYRQMRHIRSALESQLPVDRLLDPELKESELTEIHNDLEKEKDMIRRQQSIEEYEQLQLAEDEEESEDIEEEIEIPTAPPKEVIEPRPIKKEEVTMPISFPVKESIVVAPAFDVAQFQQIYLGQRRQMNIALYAKPEYSAPQMHEIRLGLEAGLAPVPYAHAGISSENMREIRLAMLNDGFRPTTHDLIKELRMFQMEQLVKNHPWITPALFRDFSFSKAQATEILSARLAGIGTEIDLLMNPCFSASQMREIRLGLVQGVNASSYALPAYSVDQMREIRERLSLEISISARIKTKIHRFQRDKTFKANRKDLLHEGKE